MTSDIINGVPSAPSPEVIARIRQEQAAALGALPAYLRALRADLLTIRKAQPKHDTAAILAATQAIEQRPRPGQSLLDYLRTVGWIRLPWG